MRLFSWDERETAANRLWHRLLGRPPSTALYALAAAIEGLNEYTKRHHHGNNPNAAIEPISDTEFAGQGVPDAGADRRGLD